MTIHATIRCTTAIALALGTMIASAVPAEPKEVKRKYGGSTYQGVPQLECTGINQLVFNKSMCEQVDRSWAALDAETRSCVVKRVEIPENELRARGISANSSEISPHVQACQQASEAARKARETEIKRLAAQQDAQEKQRQAVAATKARLEARRRELTIKYGEQSADAIIAGKVFKDMSYEEVLEALGPPLRKDKIPPNYELWVYNNQRITISEGKVSYVGR